MGRTVFGRHIYAIGGNVHAAVLSGVNVKKVNFWIFVNMGFLASIAAIVTTSRAGAGIAAAGQNYELDAIAACFIGGTAVTGGVGRVSGAIVGALIMGVLNMGLSIMSVNPAWQQAIKGLVLLAAVAFDLLNKRKAAGV
jgi:putative multiple sugar transport system permease protein